MSARGDAARRARWDARDINEKKQLDAALEAWLGNLPEHLFDRLYSGMRAIYGKRMDADALRSTPEERKRAVALMTEINLAWSAGHAPSDSQPGQKENSMSLEQALAANTAALEANTAALLKGGGASSAGGTKETKTTKTDTKPKSTKSREELAAIMEKVKAAKGTPVAKGLISEVGKTAKLAEIAEENIDALYAAAEAKLGEEEEM